MNKPWGVPWEVDVKLAKLLGPATLLVLLAPNVTTATTAQTGLDLGPEEIVQSAGVDIAVTGNSVPSVADWNNDSLPDLIVGEGGNLAPGKVRIYLNQGSAAEPSFAGYLFAQSNGADLTVPTEG